MLKWVYTYFCLVQATPSTSAITCTQVFTRRRDLMQHTTKKHQSCELICPWCLSPERLLRYPKLMHF